MKVDGATSKREKLQYACVLVEVKIGQDFPDQITFLNEKSLEMVIDVSYEWKTIVCTVCKKLGHTSEECKRPIQKQEWRAKKVIQLVVDKAPIENNKENDQTRTFHRVTQKARRSEQPIVLIVVTNSFNALELMEEQVMVGTVPCIQGAEVDDRRGDPPDRNG